MIQERILELTEYGLVTGLVELEDKRYTINRLLELFGLDGLDDEVVAAYKERTPMTQETAEAALEGILKDMLDYAAEDGLMPEDTITYRDLFDTKIMGMLMPRPGEVIRKFRSRCSLFRRIRKCQLYPQIPDQKRSKMDGRYKIWNTRYYNQPLQTGERSESDRCGKTRKAERLSEVSPLQGE